MSDNKSKKVGIGLWKNDRGNMLSHSKGLTQEQVNFLQSLKAGDRMIIWPNSFKEKGHEPDFNLRMFAEQKEKTAVDEF